jgi:Reverse transcriptase (RNA-dependent DNA polymerase)
MQSYFKPYTFIDYCITRLKVYVMDVDTAFMNAPITEDIWIQVPKGTHLPDGDNGIYKLEKLFHGLQQAPKE